jgi:putative endonuclease
MAGEQYACTHLVEQGYEILEKNWRHGKDEVDIIATKDGLIIFVEVKTRSNDYAGEPHMAVGPKKQRFLIRAADAYMKSLDEEKEARFDVAGIIMNSKKTELTYVEDAFYARC